MIPNRMGKLGVMGDASIDHIFSIQEKNLSPNVEVAGRYKIAIGGKGYFSAMFATQQGHTSLLVSSVGNDPNGERIIKALDDNHVEHHLYRSNLPETDIVGVIVFHSGSDDSSAGYIGHRKHRITPDYISSISAALRTCNLLLISCDMAADAIGACKEVAEKTPKIPIIVNAAPYSETFPLERVSGANYIISTEADAYNWLKNSGIRGDADLKKIGDFLTQIAQSAIITYGSHGCIVFNREKNKPPRATRYGAFTTGIVYQHTGARATFCGAIAIKVMEAGGFNITEPAAEREMISDATAARTLVLSGILHPDRERSNYLEVTMG